MENHRASDSIRKSDQCSRQEKITGKSFIEPPIVQNFPYARQHGKLVIVDWFKRPSSYLKPGQLVGQCECDPHATLEILSHLKLRNPKIGLLIG